MGSLLSRRGGSSATAESDRAARIVQREIAFVAKVLELGKADVAEFHAVFMRQYPSGFITKEEFCTENQATFGGVDEMWRHVYRLVCRYPIPTRLDGTLVATATPLAASGDPHHQAAAFPPTASSGGGTIGEVVRPNRRAAAIASGQTAPDDEDLFDEDGNHRRDATHRRQGRGTQGALRTNDGDGWAASDAHRGEAAVAGADDMAWLDRLAQNEAKYARGIGSVNNRIASSLVESAAFGHQPTSRRSSSTLLPGDHLYDGGGDGSRGDGYGASDGDRRDDGDGDDRTGRPPGRGLDRAAHNTVAEEEEAAWGAGSPKVIPRDRRRRPAAFEKSGPAAGKGEVGVICSHHARDTPATSGSSATGPTGNSHGVGGGAAAAFVPVITAPSRPEESALDFVHVMVRYHRSLYSTSERRMAYAFGFCDVDGDGLLSLGDMITASTWLFGLKCVTAQRLYGKLADVQRYAPVRSMTLFIHAHPDAAATHATLLPLVTKAHDVVARHQSLAARRILAEASDGDAAAASPGKAAGGGGGRRSSFPARRTPSGTHLNRQQQTSPGVMSDDPSVLTRSPPTVGAATAALSRGGGPSSTGQSAPHSGGGGAGGGSGAPSTTGGTTTGGTTAPRPVLYPPDIIETVLLEAGWFVPLPLLRQFYLTEAMFIDACRSDHTLVELFGTIGGA